MWDIPAFRARAYARSLRNRRRGPGQNQTAAAKRIHIGRLNADVRLVGGLTMHPAIVRTRMLSVDFLPESIKLFSPIAFRKGQKVAISLDLPRPFYIKGKVIECHDAPIGTLIVTPTPFNHRVRIALEFNSMEEKLAVQSFIQEIHQFFG